MTCDPRLVAAKLNRIRVCTIEKLKSIVSANGWRSVRSPPGRSATKVI